MNFDAAVIGGGAAGLACAVKLGGNLKIALIDAGDRLGKKLAATGNGQGNVSNTDMTAGHFHGGGARLAGKIACANPFVYKELFDCLFTCDERGRIYPAGRQASSLGDNLIRKLGKNTQIFTSVKVNGIDAVKNGFRLTLSDGREITAEYAVLCAGGKAQKQFKTDGTAYALAQKFGHAVTPLYPSLVQLKTDTEYIRTLKGVRADCEVGAFSNGKLIKSERGDVIFTEYGVSGNAVFSLSSSVTDKPDAYLSLGFLPDIPSQTIRENLMRRKSAGYAERDLLSGNLHNALGRAIINRSGGQVDGIVDTLKNFRLKIKGTLGFDYAQVTRGGIDVKDVTDRLESKFAENLFFAGEILDVDGDCGGYNLHWAFASGAAVASAILERI